MSQTAARAGLTVTSDLRCCTVNLMQPVRDHQLPEPYRSWIDRGKPLPADVRLLPRSVRFVHDLLYFILSCVMVLGIAVILIALFGDDLLRPPLPVVLVARCNRLENRF